MAHLVGSQSERRKFGLDQSESRISPMWLFDVTTIVLAHVTPPEVTPQSPGSDRATAPQSPEVTTWPEVTSQPEVTPPRPRKWHHNRKWPRNRKWLPQTPEVTSQPEVTPQTPGSGLATGSDSQTPRSARATGSQEMCSIAQWNNWALYLC